MSPIAQRIEAMSGTEYMGHVKRLGCLCCRLMGIPDAIHRIRRRVEKVWGMSEQQMAEQTRNDVAALLACDVRYARAA